MKGDEMIRVTYLKGKNAGRSKAFTTNPFLQILFLSILFVISARFHPYFSTQSIFVFMGLAAILAFPAAVYYFTRSARAFFVARNDLPNETVSMADFVNAHQYSKNF